MYSFLTKILNVIAYICFLDTNLYIGLGPQNNKSPYSNTHSTYITPASFTFGIWGLIHLLLGGFVIYQFFTPTEEIVVEGINWHFISISFWNTAWLVLWIYDFLILSCIAILLAVCQFSYVYWILKLKYPPQKLDEQLWIHIPFYLYHAWINVIFLLSAFAAFSPEKLTDQEPSLFTKVLVFLGLFVLGVIAISYVEQFDSFGPIIIAWSLYGIAAGQEDEFIHWSAIVIGTISALYIFKPLIINYIIRRPDNIDAAPLIP
ncbi:5197_t:CDS:2 [Cetraspora pellucida]|uniref:5197_t:CDS:1 n=1 Tax=Cetraspora pellucida TaxID=1433469 RepID=A0A9N9N8B2_9GLOM|nr:5197_t:CDS:2 [Cetraspora pellucida]